MEDDAMRELYEASLNGCVSTLNTLIQKDPLILSKVSLYTFTETPLHIASLLGHLNFCQVLLQNSPSLATEVDSEGRSPLHLASAKGHTEVVKALLRTNPEMCLVCDKDEMLPLHFAAMRGRVGAIKELIQAKPESIPEMVQTRDGSVLHLCVRYNHLEALKLIVELLRGDHQFLSLQDQEDNSLLRLAVKRRQIKIIKYLLSLSEMGRLNGEGLTGTDMLERCRRDLMRQHILTEGGEMRANEVIAEEAVSSETLINEQQRSPSTSRQQSMTIIIVHPEVASETNNDPLEAVTSANVTNEQEGQERWNRFERFCKTYLLDQGNWIDKKTREQLMVAATVIATMTFQSALSPPGGVWQGDTTQDGFTCSNFGFCEAGTAVVGYAWSPDFLKFIFLNSASFFASLCVMLILMSGFPLENKVVMWILAFLMIVAASCMLLTYMWALGLVSPNHIYYRIRKLGYLLVGIWTFLLALVILVQTSRIVFWARSRSRRNSSTNAPLTHSS